MRKLLLVSIGWIALIAFPSWSQEPADKTPGFKRVEDVIYGRKFGTALTMDVFQPEQPNGYGILFMVSGGFFSSKEAINGRNYLPFLERGYTVFAVVHGSQPKFQIPEVTQDIHRAVRFIRHNAATYGVNADKLGISGGSAGGHLSLTMATQGKPGKPDAKNPIDRENSSIQAAACFFPPTDFLNYGQPGEDAVGVGTLKGFKAAFGARADTLEGRQELGKEISPIYFINSNMAPTLIIHGDADKLVPLQQAQTFAERAKENGAVCKVIVREGKDHGWPEMKDDMKIFADWFDQYLRGRKPKG